jgi:hypothetical protein
MAPPERIRSALVSGQSLSAWHTRWFTSSYDSAEQASILAERCVLAACCVAVPMRHERLLLPSIRAIEAGANNGQIVTASDSKNLQNESTPRPSSLLKCRSAPCGIVRASLRPR